MRLAFFEKARDPLATLGADADLRDSPRGLGDQRVVDRRARHNTVDQCIQAFQERDHFILTVPPEGTRSQVDYWKTGFYHIAHGAGVPIVLGFLDFKRKVGGLGPAIWTTGDIHADVARIREFYLDVVGKNPELMSEIRVRPEAAAEVEARRAAM